MHIDFQIMILGGGASGRWLLHYLKKNDVGNKTQIGLIERDPKKESDRTWCFWQKEPLESILEKMVSHSWHLNSRHGINYSLAPYTYYHLPSKHFYQNIPENLNPIYEEVTELIQKDQYVEVITNKNRYTASYVFTSIPAKKQTRVFNQSFCGWIMKSKTSKFNPEAFKMMDFSIDQEKGTQFIYVLPFSETEALVEVTRFSNTIISKKEALRIRNAYLGKDEYTEIGYESGAIPMTSAFDHTKKNFKKNTRIIPIGTSGGATKPSTGYTFLRAKHHAEKIANAIKYNQPIPTCYRKSRFRMYDRLLLDILQQYPEKGKDIFSCLFENIPLPLVLKFLDEETNIWEEILIFKSLPKRIFLQALIRDLS